MALLVVAAALVDGYLQTRSAEMGFDPHPLLVAFVENPDGVPVATTMRSARGLNAKC